MTTLDLPTGESASIAEDFFLWALASLRLDVKPGQDGTYELQIPEALGDSLGDCDVLRFGFHPASDDSPAAESAEIGSPLWQRVIRLLRGLGSVVPASPRGQPVSVHQLAPRILTSYDVADGHLHLGGCSLDDQPILRFTYWIRSKIDTSHDRLVHVYRAPDARPIDDGLLRALHVSDLVPPSEKTPRVSSNEATQWRASGSDAVPVVSGDERAEFLVATVIWCKFVRCRVLFEVGDGRAEVALNDWAQLLADGLASPPPFQCSETGCQAYQLVTTDDGRITVPDALETCSESGRCVLSTDLETCSLTNRRVLSEYLATCPVTETRLLETQLVTCELCRQPVDPRCLQQGRCQACRALEPVSRDDARMAQVLGEYPSLDRWSRWKLSETRTVYVLSARSFFRRLLAVVDKETLQLVRLAESAPLSRVWNEVPSERRESFLK